MTHKRGRVLPRLRQGARPRDPKKHSCFSPTALGQRPVPAHRLTSLSDLVDHLQTPPPSDEARAPACAAHTPPVSFCTRTPVTPSQAHSVLSPTTRRKSSNEFSRSNEPSAIISCGATGRTEEWHGLGGGHPASERRHGHTSGHPMTGAPCTARSIAHGRHTRPATAG